MPFLTRLRKSRVVRFWNRCRKYSLQGWVRYFRLKLQGKQLVITGRCLLCGKCCQRISLEAGGRWLREEKDFARVLSVNEEYRRFQVVGKDDQGFLLFSCSWYSSAGLCRDHENRLDICKSYPDCNLYFTGGRLINGCGYSFKEIVPFKKYLAEELQTEHAESQKKDSDT